MTDLRDRIRAMADERRAAAFEPPQSRAEAPPAPAKPAARAADAPQPAPEAQPSPYERAEAALRPWIAWLQGRPTRSGWPTRTNERSPEGSEIVIAWMDCTRLRFKDHLHLTVILPISTAAMYVVALTHRAAYSTHAADFYFSLTLLLLAGAAGIWAWKLIKERPREVDRHLTLRPDGSLSLFNVELGPHRGPFDVTDGVRRITSVEYTKTAEWSVLDKEKVFAPEHWYDVIVFLDEEHRVSISRNFGSRDHPFKVAGMINKALAEARRQGVAPATRPARVPIS